MRITVAGLGDLILGPGTHLSDIADFAALHSDSREREWWCGPRRVPPHHPAGVPPLVHGARLTHSPGPMTWPPSGPHLVAISGPDAGAIVELGQGQVVVGRRADVEINDPAMSARHFAVNSTGDTVTDLGSTNGTWTTRWPRVAHSVREGDLIRSGTTVWQRRPSRRERPTEPREPISQQRLAAVVTSAVAGVMMATVAGSPLLVALGLLFPIRVLIPYLTARRPVLTSVPGWDWDPSGAQGWASPLHGTIAVTGPPDVARGFARALMIARHAASPDWEEEWVRWLPTGERVVVVPPQQDPPAWATSVAEVGPHTTQVRTGTHTHTIATAALSVDNADAAARRIANALGTTDLTDHVRWADLDRVAAGFGMRHMRVPLGLDARGTHTLDLDTRGPHVLIAGARGSGKSTLLETIGLALAYDHGPRDLNIILVDCAEGHGPRRLDSLPHLTHVVRDPDSEQIKSLLHALATTVTSRIDAMAQTHHTTFPEWERSSSAPPRTLVLIDDFHCLVRDHPPAADALVRIAKLARPVGLHLVLSTGRPAGVVTSDVRKAMDVTVALRVDSPSHSTALIGTDHCARISPLTPGRAMVNHQAITETIHIALPYVDPTPLVRTVGDLPAVGAIDLADRVVARWKDAPLSPVIGPDGRMPRSDTPAI